MNLQRNMTIDPGSHVSDVQRNFTAHFPYLRLKFLKTASEKKSNSTDSTLADAGLTLTAKIVDHNKKVLINETMTVAELTSAFNDYFGVQIEVLRKSGNVWLETNLTNNWTLQQQNKMGESIS
ncbi:MAG: hypothetical protein ABI861_05290 [Panacibacter sp.]